MTSKASGTISGTWLLTIGSVPLLKFKQTALSFDDTGGIRFHVDPHNIEMPGVLKFISDALSSLVPKDSGLSIGLLPDGFQSILSLPIPDIQFGTFGISNLSLGANFAIRDAGEFRLTLGANLAKRDAPFFSDDFHTGRRGIPGCAGGLCTQHRSADLSRGTRDYGIREPGDFPGRD